MGVFSGLRIFSNYFLLFASWILFVPAYLFRVSTDGFRNGVSGLVFEIRIGLLNWD